MEKRLNSRHALFGMLACVVFGLAAFLCMPALDPAHHIASSRKSALIRVVFGSIGFALGLKWIAILTTAGVLACGIWWWRAFRHERTEAEERVRR